MFKRYKYSSSKSSRNIQSVLREANSSGLRNDFNLLHKVDKYLGCLHNSGFVWRRIQGLQIQKSTFEKAAISFRRALDRNELVGITKQDIISSSTHGQNLDRIILPHLFKFIQENYQQENTVFNNLMSLSDLRSPADWYPETRKIKRKIIMHVGPTNSGKTYHALKRFKSASSALYCGPLRLLAHEVYERMNSNGIPCNLVTGEERKESNEIFKWSSTVEMANLGKRFDVAILDEIQMIGDLQRGFAWTRALLGIQASELHLCGEESAVDLVKKLCTLTGEDLEVKKYQRLTTLTVDKHSLKGKFQNVTSGDCVVAFSRKDIFAIKKEIEKVGKHSVAVIYGSLPSEIRADQARLFNNPNSHLDVLVASDAIGMGLNLNIRRIVFDTFQKFDGKNKKYLTVSQSIQIAGRAGRFGTQSETGLVTTFEADDFPRLKKYMMEHPSKIKMAGLMPQLEQIKKFGSVFPNMSFTELLRKFSEFATVDGSFFLCNLDDQIKISTLLEGINLNLGDRFTFIQSPCNLRDELAEVMIKKFAEIHSQGKICPISIIPTRTESRPSSALQELESRHRLIMLYLWLSMRFPETFADIDSAQIEKANVEKSINKALESIEYRPRQKRHMQGIQYRDFQ